MWEILEIDAAAWCVYMSEDEVPLHNSRNILRLRYHRISLRCAVSAPFIFSFHLEFVVFWFASSRPRSICWTWLSDRQVEVMLKLLTIFTRCQRRYVFTQHEETIKRKERRRKNWAENVIAKDWKLVETLTTRCDLKAANLIFTFSLWLSFGPRESELFLLSLRLSKTILFMVQ